jgi:hypothetical protein
MTVLIASGPELPKHPGGRPPGRGNRRTDPVLIARMERVHDAVMRGRHYAEIAEQEGVSVETIDDDIQFLDGQAKTRFKRTLQERADHVEGIFLKGADMAERTYYSTPDPHAQIKAVNSMVTCGDKLMKFYRLEQPTVGEHQAASEKEGADGAAVTINNDNRQQFAIGSLEWRAMMAELESQVPQGNISDYREELGADNIKLPGEVLDVDYDPDAEEGDEEL